MRFVVVTHGSGRDEYYSVNDKEAYKWNMPDKSVSIFFGDTGRAQDVADRLNKEWSMFLANPR